MATKVYLRSSGTLTGVGSIGANVVDPQNVNVQTKYYSLSLSQGASVFAQTATTITGPISGVYFGDSSSFRPIFISPPLAAGVTISGTITFNLWGLESNMNANGGFQVVIKRLDNTGQVVSQLCNSEFGTELNTSDAVNTWTVTPTSTTFAKGDRIAVIVCLNDAGGTLASGFTLTLNLNGGTTGASGDSYVQFNETITFTTTAPSGTTWYLTDTASDVSGSGKKAAATSRGSGSVNSVTNTAAGPVSPIQCTDTGGGTVLEWYTPPLAAFTLAGLVQFNVRAKASDATAQTATSMRAEVAVCAADGTLVSVWGSMGEDATNSLGAAIGTTTDTAQIIWVSGADLSVSAGQRLRFRLYIDDATNPLVASKTATVTYNGTSAAAAGDTYAVLTQTTSLFGYFKSGYGKENG